MSATLLAVPNVSEGRDRAAIAAIAAAFDGHMLAYTSDPDHHRSVYTLAGAPGALHQHVLAGARETLTRVDLARHHGIHPRVGALDVAPIVHLDDATRGAACAEALVLADALAHELNLPVFLYGELGGGRTRAALRKGGPHALQQRLDAGELAPDFGPRRLHPTAGAVLVAARPPLVAFNVELAPPADRAAAQKVAARVREGGAEGLPGVRALGLWLEHRGVAQVSTNIEDHRAVPLARLLEVIARHATPAAAELVAPAPEAALAGFPAGLPLSAPPTIEQALTAVN